MPDVQAPEASGEAGGSPKSGAAEFIIEIDQSLAKLAAMMQQAQVPPESVQAMQAAIESFHAAVESMTGQKGGPAPAQGSATMNQGGSSKAVPAY